MIEKKGKLLVRVVTDDFLYLHEHDVLAAAIRSKLKKFHLKFRGNLFFSTKPSIMHPITWWREWSEDHGQSFHRSYLFVLTYEEDFEIFRVVMLAIGASEVKRAELSNTNIQEFDIGMELYPYGPVLPTRGKEVGS